MSSVTQGDGFTEVTLGRKKRKASNSPALPSQALTSPPQEPQYVPDQALRTRFQ